MLTSFSLSHPFLVFFDDLPHLPLPYSTCQLSSKSLPFYPPSTTGNGTRDRGKGRLPPTSACTTEKDDREGTGKGSRKARDVLPFSCARRLFSLLWRIPSPVSPLQHSQPLETQNKVSELQKVESYCPNTQNAQDVVILICSLPFPSHVRKSFPSFRIKQGMKTHGT